MSLKKRKEPYNPQDETSLNMLRGIPIDHEKSSALVPSVEIYLIALGICIFWCGFIFSLLVYLQFPITKHYWEVVLMVIVPLFVCVFFLWVIDTYIVC